MYSCLGYSAETLGSGYCGSMFQCSPFHQNNCAFGSKCIPLRHTCLASDFSRNLCHQFICGQLEIYLQIVYIIDLLTQNPRLLVREVHHSLQCVMNLTYSTQVCAVFLALTTPLAIGVIVRFEQALIVFAIYNYQILFLFRRSVVIINLHLCVVPMEKLFLQDATLTPCTFQLTISKNVRLSRNKVIK